ncbi:hypothetical protein Ahia01_000069400 [Argonauta hians]
MYSSHSQRVLLLCLIYESVFVHIVFPFLTSIQADPKLKKKFGLTRKECGESCRSEREFDCKYYKYVENNGICLISGDKMEDIKKYTSKSIERSLFKEISTLKQSIDKLNEKFSYLDEMSNSISELKSKANKESKSLLLTGKQFKETVMRQELSVAALGRKVKEIEFKANQQKTDIITIKGQTHQFLRQMSSMKNLFDIISLEVKDSASELTSLSAQMKNMKKATETLRGLVLNHKGNCNSCNNGKKKVKSEDGGEESDKNIDSLATAVSQLEHELAHMKSQLGTFFVNMSEVEGQVHSRISKTANIMKKIKALEVQLNVTRKNNLHLKKAQRDMGAMFTQLETEINSWNSELKSTTEASKDSLKENRDLRRTLKTIQNELKVLKDLDTHSKMKYLASEQGRIDLRLHNMENTRDVHQNQIAQLNDKVSKIKTSSHANCSTGKDFDIDIENMNDAFENQDYSNSVSSNIKSYGIDMNPPYLLPSHEDKILKTERQEIKISPPDAAISLQQTINHLAPRSDYDAFLKPSLYADKPIIKAVKRCRVNWFKTSRRCLHYIPRSVSWKVAKADCLNINAKVASLYSVAEWNDIKIFLAIYSDLNIPLWLNQNSIKALNPKEFKSLMIVETDSSDLSRKYEENCLVLDPSNNFTLSLVSCETKSKFAIICEIPLYSPETANQTDSARKITKTTYESSSSIMGEKGLPANWKNASEHEMLCPPFAKETGGYCFKYIPVKQSNKRAIKTCKRLGANLVTVQNLQKELMLENFLVTIGTPQTIWLSPTWMVSDGTWKWASTNEVVTYTNYFPGRPDTLRKTRCNQIKKAWGFKWLDKYCWNTDEGVKHSFVCEFKGFHFNSN